MSDDAFPRLVDQWLTERNWSQSKLAKAMGVSQSLVSKHLADDNFAAEGGRRVRPSPANLAKYSKVTGIPFEDLMRLNGYLPGQVVARSKNPTLEMRLEDDVRAQVVEFMNAVKEAPRTRWPDIVRATLPMAILGARAMTLAYRGTSNAV